MIHYNPFLSLSPILFPCYKPFPTLTVATSSQPPLLLSLRLPPHRPRHHHTVLHHRHTASSSIFLCQPTTIFSVTIEPRHPITKNYHAVLDCHQIKIAPRTVTLLLMTLAPVPLNHVAAPNPLLSLNATCVVGMSLTPSVTKHNQLQKVELAARRREV